PPESNRAGTTRSTRRRDAPSAGFPFEHDTQRIPGESPERSKAVVEISHVVLLDQVRRVAEDGDRRRRGLDLRRVVEFDLAPRRLWRLASRQQFAELRVHLGGADALGTLLFDLLENLQHTRDALSSQSRRKQERHELQEGRLVSSRLFVLRGRLVVFGG